MKTFTEKILLTIVVLITIYAIVVTFEKRSIESKYYNEIDNTEELSDSIANLHLRFKNLTLKQQIRTKNVQKESNAINDKLKTDEEIIDNSDISDNELADFISKHENR